MSSVLAAAVAPSVGFWLYSHGWIWLCAVTTLLNLTMAVIAWCMVDDRSAAHERTRAVGAASSGASSRCRRRSSSTPTATVRSAASARYSPMRVGIHPKSIYLTTFALVDAAHAPVHWAASATGSATAGSSCRASSSSTLGMIGAGVSPRASGAGCAPRRPSRSGFGTAYPGVCGLGDAGRRPRAPRRRVRRDPRGVRHRHRAGIDDERLADWPTRLSAAFGLAAALSALALPAFLLGRAPVRPSSHTTHTVPPLPEARGP